MVGAGAAAAAPAQAERKFHGRNVTLHAEHQSLPALRASRDRSTAVQGGTPTADIQVTYTGFTANAQAAFEAAVEVWEHILVSNQPIDVDAHWTGLGSGILGSAGPDSVWLGDDGYVYPKALAEAICDCEEEPGFEIHANFNSNFSSWYLGTDGNVPSNKWDFFSVVLHELGHGLGFISSFEVFGGKGYWGYTNNGINIFPLRFDSYEMTASTGRQLAHRRLQQRLTSPQDTAHRRNRLLPWPGRRCCGRWTSQAIRAEPLAAGIEQLPRRSGAL